MKVYNINTTLRLLTDLSKVEITLIIKPIVENERLGGVEYTNSKLLRALIFAYPGRIIEELTEIDITI